MVTNEPFGFDPDDLDRIFPGTGEQLRGGWDNSAGCSMAPVRDRAGPGSSTSSAAIPVRRPISTRPAIQATVSG